MFTFSGRITRGSFLPAAVLRLVLFIASVFAFPFLLTGLAKLSGCAGIGGACGAVGLIGATIYKPLAFNLLVFSFIGISLRRTRDAGMPAAVGLLIPLLISADSAFLIYSGAPWSLAFSAGVLTASFPRFALLALYCIGILCLLPSRNDRGKAGNPFGLAGWIAAGFGAVVACSAALRLTSLFVVVLPLLPQIVGVTRTIVRFTPLAIWGFGATLAFIAWRYRKSPPSDTAPVPTTAGAGQRPAPVLLLLILALLPTLLAVADGFRGEFSLAMAMLVNLNTIVLPTLALYFFLLLGLWLMVIRRTVKAALLPLLALLPFAHWGYAHWVAWKDHAREIAEIAAVPTGKLPQIPATIVIESESSGGLRAAWTVPAIEHIILKEGRGSTLRQVERLAPNENTARQSTVTALPPEYLLMRLGRSSSFYKAGRLYSAAGGPFELRHVDPAHDDLIGVWYRVYNPSPTRLPVLTGSGWFRGSNSITTTDYEQQLGEFLHASLNRDR